MEKRLKDDELNNVTGGNRSYARSNTPDNPSLPNPHPSSPELSGSAIRAECATCHVVYTGAPASVQSKVDMHLKTTNHAYFTYTSV